MCNHTNIIYISAVKEDAWNSQLIFQKLFEWAGPSQSWFWQIQKLPFIISNKL